MAKSFQYKGKDYDFGAIAAKVAAIKSQLPDAMATTALNFFVDSFRRQGWRDKGLTKWKPRKGNVDPGRAVLVKRGHLRTSIRKMLVSWQRSEIGTNHPAAEAHNEGFNGNVSVKAHSRRKRETIREKYVTKSGSKRNRSVKVTTGSYKVRAHTRKANLPQRQFMGDSEVLNMKLDKVMSNAIDKLF